MKVKNIMFSGAMAAILGVTGANAAVTVASQGYVDSKVGEVATSVSTLETNVANTYLTQEDAADTYATTQYVTENVTNILGNETDGLVADVAANADAIAGLQSSKANAADVYTKTEANELLATKADVDDVYAKTQTYTQDEVKAYVSQTLTDIGEGNISLEGYAKTQDVNNALALKADKTQVATDIANAVAGKADAANVYSKTDADSTFATKTALSDVDAKFADYTKTSELDSTFATDAELKAVDDKFANYTTTAELTTTLNSYATTTALKAEEDARKAADEAATAALGNVYTKTEADAAFDKAGSAADVEAKLKLLATADVPVECQSESNTCVLSYNGTTFSWAPLTATPTVAE